MLDKLCKRLLTTEAFKLLVHRFGLDPDDVLQEVALVLCKQAPEMLEKIDNSFNFWVSRVIMNMCGSTGQLGKLKGRMIEAVELVDFDYDPAIDERIEAVEDCIGKMYWYDKDMFYTYIEKGSLRKVEAATGIPYISVWNTVNKVKEKVKQQVK